MNKTMMMAMVAVAALSVNALGANLIVNGDFEAGNTGFSTDYTYVAPPLTGSPASLGAPGVYSVDTNPQNGHSAWASFGDHTSGSGKMLIVNAACDDVAPTPGVEVIWEQTVTVTPGKNYLLTYWLANSYGTNRAAIQVYVDGVEVGGLASFTDVGIWHSVSLTWTSGIDTTVTITLKDLTRKYDGDDFVIDDISLLEEQCETAYGFYDVAGKSTCFNTLGFDNWGWRIGPIGAGTYELDLYAGAGQCDQSKGTFVGTASVDYSGGTVEVTFDLEDGYTRRESHVYAGTAPLPTDKKGKQTVAPGQYTIAATLTGDIYVIVHAVVGMGYE